MEANIEKARPLAGLLQAGAALRFFVGMVGIVAFILAWGFANHVEVWNSGVVYLVLFTLKAGFEWWRPDATERAGERAAYLSPAIDILLVSGWLYALGGLYGGTAAATLKAPGFVYYFPLILGAALWLRPLPVLFAGAMSMGVWFLMVVMAQFSGLGTTMSYQHYLTSTDLMPLVEAEKLLGLGVFSLLLALFTRYAARLRDILPDRGLDVRLGKVAAGDGPSTLFGPRQGEIRIFAAEDNGVNRLVLEKMVEEQGFKIDGFEDGEQLTRAVKAAHEAGDLPHLILLDLDMPIMGGVEACQWLRRFERENALQRTPVLAVTAQSDDVVKAVCEKAGMDGHLAKPVSRQSLFAAMLSAAIASNGAKTAS